MEKHKFIRVLILVSIIIALVLLLYVTIDYTYFSIFPDLSEPDAFNYCRCNNLKNKTGRVVNGLQVDRDDLKWVAFLFLRFSCKIVSVYLDKCLFHFLISLKMDFFNCL